MPQEGSGLNRQRALGAPVPRSQPGDKGDNGSSPWPGTERCYGAGGEEMATSSLHLTRTLPGFERKPLI